MLDQGLDGALEAEQGEKAERGELWEAVRDALNGEETRALLETNDAAFEFSLVPTWDDAGQVSRVIVVGADITERKHTEAARDSAL